MRLINKLKEYSGAIVIGATMFTALAIDSYRAADRKNHPVQRQGGETVVFLPNATGIDTNNDKILDKKYTYVFLGRMAGGLSMKVNLPVTQEDQDFYNSH